jgi:hypothetical protein
MRRTLLLIAGAFRECVTIDSLEFPKLLDKAIMIADAPVKAAN